MKLFREPQGWAGTPEGRQEAIDFQHSFGGSRSRIWALGTKQAQN